MDNTIAGYLILATLALGGAGFAGFKIHSGERRTYLRRRRRERAASGRRIG